MLEEIQDLIYISFDDEAGLFLEQHDEWVIIIRRNDPSRGLF